MKTIACIIIILIVQYEVCTNGMHKYQDRLDHRKEQNRENTNEWVVHVPKGEDRARKFA